MAAAVGQSRLMATYDNLFARKKLRIGQVLLTHDDLENRRRHLNARNTMLKLLEYGVIPIVNENDVVSADEIKFGDNDLLASRSAMLIGADLLVLLTTVNGFHAPDAKGVGGACHFVRSHGGHLVARERQRQRAFHRRHEQQTDVGHGSRAHGHAVVIANAARTPFCSRFWRAKTWAL